MNNTADRNEGTLGWVPPLAAALSVALFVALGFWQLDRAEQKRAMRAAFENPNAHLELEAGLDAGREFSRDDERYQPLVVTGRYLLGRQFLLDNIILDGRLGYFVVTPLEWSVDRPLLLVNRGWLPGRPGDNETVRIALEEASSGMSAAAEGSVRGRVGQLPRVGIRAGEAFPEAGEADGWPRVANWPTLEELAQALERDVLPFVLLQDPQPDAPFLRRWEPEQIGPGRHLGYAFQWFALAAAVIVISIVVYRKGRMRG